MSQHPFHWTQQHLSDEERRLRLLAEQKAESLGRMFEELAHRLAPDRVEACRRSDPGYFQQLDVAGWQAFWRLAGSGATGWGMAPGDAGAVKALAAEVETLRSENRELRQELELLRQLEAETPSPVPSPANAVMTSSPPSSPAAESAPSQDLPAIVLPDRPPQAFALRFTNWPREGLALATLAARGWSLRHSIAQVLANRFGITATAGSLKRLFAQLDKAGFWRMETVSVGQSSVVLVTLTPVGRQVTTAAGFVCVESELDLLLAQHGGERQLSHAALVCMFTHQARMRGYQTQVCPPVDGVAAPDVLLEKQGERTFVEVEAESGDPERRMRKWRNQVELQGYVALCALTPESCRRQVAEAQAAGGHGKATDLDTLFKQPGLWVLEW